MYILVGIFYLSLLGMSVMVFLKSREVRTGHPTMISRMFVKTDHIFQTAYAFVRRGLSYLNKHSFIWLAQWVAYHILRHVRVAYIDLRARAHDNPHTKKVMDMLRGRGEIKKHGASFYLKRIAGE